VSDAGLFMCAMMMSPLFTACRRATIAARRRVAPESAFKWAPKAGCALADGKTPRSHLACLSSEQFVKDVFLDSDTDMMVLSFVPSKREASPLEIEAVLHISDDEPSPEQAAIDRSELRLLVDVISGLPARQRQILLMSRLENKPHAVIADHFDVSTRTVELELKRALSACHALRRK